MPIKEIRKAPKEALVVFAFMQAWTQGVTQTDDELADYAGCARTSIYRMPVFMRIRAYVRALGKAALPRGSKTTNTDGFLETSRLEAWRNDQDEDEDQ
jgi:hypothetical protein